MRRILVLLTCFLTLSSCAWGQGGEVKILYWNIQNGMWHDQGNHYDNFVAFVKTLDPDICVYGSRIPV